METTNTRYTVTDGGSSISFHDTLDEAIAECWAQARHWAQSEGIDEDDLDEYGTDNPYADRWGVCPSNNDGAYWPCVRRVA